ncbi:condensin complex subunit 3 [Neocloeon triangulifer]|uniref:condensin complex subunit 3 n=1 Tax=Neocloeon triangulifer TaxID=2078957 RepID=UPI00286EE86B|nr:condensin complex subunit 3 [Neocloeon triangulifer]
MPKRKRDRRSTEDARPPAQIFGDFQEAGNYLTEKYESELEEFFHKHEDDENLFENYFYHPLLCLLNAASDSPFTKRTIPLVVSFVANRLAEEDANDERESASPFVRNFFELIFQVQGLDNKNFRFNSCKFMVDLLAKLAEKDVSMDDDLCAEMSKIMINDRIIDKAVDIRELAAQVLQWLQDPTSQSCEVTKTLMFHLDKDPSVEVRKTILGLIRVSSVTVPSIAMRTRDISESVRIMAYKILADRRRMNSLSFSLREKIIMSGLNDTSAAVREVVENYLLPKWLERLSGDLVEFAENLDVNCRPLVPRRALPHLLKNKTTEELIAFLRLEDGEKYPKMEKLTPGLSLYWSCLAKYFSERDDSESLERILGNVTQLVHYVDCYYKQEMLKDIPSEDQKDETLFRTTIFINLLELFSFCDMSNEVGRGDMTAMLLDVLNNKEYQPDRRLLTKVMAQLLLGLPDPYSRVDSVLTLLTDLYNPLVEPEAEPTRVISAEEKRALNLAIAFLKKDLCNLHISKEKAIDNEQFAEAQELKAKIEKVRDEIKEKEEEMKGPVIVETQTDDMERQQTDDPHVQYKCLVILCELLRNEEVMQLTQSFHEIMDTFVRHCVSIDEEALMINAFEALGLHSMQSPEIAVKNLTVFYAVLITDVRPYDRVRAKCIQCIAALLVHHGPEKLSIPQEEWEEPLEAMRLGVPINEQGYLLCIVKNMDSESDIIKRQAIMGACQLLLSGRVKSPKLLAKIVFLWFSPTTGPDHYLINMMGKFLSCFSVETPGALQILTDSLLIALDEILNCSHMSDLQELDPKEIGLFILDLTKPGTNKYTNENYHDLIARKLLEKLEFEDSVSTQSTYLRLLVNLAISYDVAAVRDSLLQTVRRIRRSNLVNSKNGDILKLILNLQGQPTGELLDSVSSTPRSPGIRRTLITNKENLITPIRNSGDQEMDSDDDEDSIFKTPPRIIPRL